jgi:acyl-CoA synthetase (AMP-forming)/AMP-acid ligase II
VVVYRRIGEALAVTMTPGRDVWWDDAIAAGDPSVAATPVQVDSEHPLFILYTSGSTGKPKGVLHTSGGYLAGVYLTCKYVFDLRPDDIFWCTADIGWVTGHSYVVYGPLCNGATVMIYEGAPNAPDPGAAVADRRAPPADDPVHRADGDPGVHALGRPVAGARRTCRACACSARWASRSGRRRGTGITGRSAGAAARSSIRGGRPRPGRSS